VEDSSDANFPFGFNIVFDVSCDTGEITKILVKCERIRPNFVSFPFPKSEIEGLVKFKLTLAATRGKIFKFLIALERMRVLTDAEEPSVRVRTG